MQEAIERSSPEPPPQARPTKGPGSALLYFVLGATATWVALKLESGLLDLVGFDDRPAWVGPLRLALYLAPLAGALALLAHRLATGRRWPWLAFALGTLLPWAGLSALFFGPSALEYAMRGDFDAERWREAAWSPEDGYTSSARVRMVDDLIDSRILDDLDSGEVRELLGPDDSIDGTGYGRGYFTSWDEVYYLGDVRTLIDSEWLVIRYGPDDHVSSYELVMD